MFVFSLKAANIKKMLLIVLAAILILTGAFVLLKRGGESKSTVKNGMNLDANLGADYRFRQDDHIIVIGRSNEVFKLASKA